MTTAAVGTGTVSDAMVHHQIGVLDKIMKATDGKITAAFSDAIAAVMPSAAAFRSAYQQEQQRLASQASQDEQEGASEPPKVSLSWLAASGFLGALVGSINDNITNAQAQANDAVSDAADEAYDATRATSAAMVAQASGQPVSQVQMAQSVAALLQASGDATPDSSDTGSQVSQKAKQALLAGVMNGLSSQALMLAVQTVLQGALSAALGLGENAVIDASRDAMSLTITNNGTLVDGWVWVCTFDDSCLSCMMMDGTFHDASETLDSHINCACLQAPYAGSPDALDMLQTGEQWLMNDATDAELQQILGPAKYEAYQSGDVGLMDLVTKEGGYYHERSLKSLGLDFRDYLQVRPTKAEMREIASAQVLGPHPFTSVELTADEERLLAEAAQLAYAPEMPAVPGIVEEATTLPNEAAVRDAFAQKLIEGIGDNPRITYRATIDGHDYFVKKLPYIASEARERAGVALLQDLGDEYVLPTAYGSLADETPYMIQPWTGGETLESVENAAAVLQALPVEDRARLTVVDYLLGQGDKGLANYLVLPDGSVRLTDFEFLGDAHSPELDLSGPLVRDAYGATPLREIPIPHDILDTIQAQRDALVTDARSARMLHDASIGFQQRLDVLDRLAALDNPTLADLQRLGAGEEVIGDVSPEVTALRANRAALQTQRDAVHAKLDTLSQKWRSLVLKEAELDPEEDEAAIAKMEKQIAAVEKQQSAQMAKLDKLDGKIAALEQRIAKAAPQGELSPEELKAVQATVKDLQAQRLSLVAERTTAEEAKDELIDDQLALLRRIQREPPDSIQIPMLQKAVDDLQTRIDALDTKVVDLSHQIRDTSAQLQDTLVSVRGQIGLYSPEEVRLPFSDTITIPSPEELFVAPGREEEKSENALQKLLDQQNVAEAASDSKARIADDLADRLQDNTAFQQMAVDRGVSSTQLASDLVQSWGAKYSVEEPLLIAEHMAVQEEFGLSADIIHADAKTLAAAKKFYKQYSEALRAFERAQYDATQEWFAANGITEVDLYRGFNWVGDREALLPDGIDWGKPAYGYAEAPTPGVGEVAIPLNPLSSFSVDPEQAWMFAGQEDEGYHLVVGAKVPVERILGTAQTGYGSKAEAEMVVLGNMSDNVKYEASVIRYGDLADEEQISATTLVYHADDMNITVTAKPNGRYRITIKGEDTYEAPRTVKSVAQVNKTLSYYGVANIYKAPEEVAQAAELTSEAAAVAAPATTSALTYTLPEIDQEAESAVIQQAQDALAGDGVASHSEVMALGSPLDDYLQDRMGPLADYAQEAYKVIEPGAKLTPEQVAWLKGDTSQHDGLTVRQAMDQYQAAMRDETARLLDQVRGTGGDLDLAEGADAGVADAVDQMQQVLPSDWIEASNSQGKLALEGDAKQMRGYYNAARGGGGIIALRTAGYTDEQLETAAIHELGHRMEDSTNGVWLLEKEFYNARTADEDFVDLDPAFQVSGRAKTDAWAIQYLGKEPLLVQRGMGVDASGEKLRAIYHYELLSVGLEWLLGNDVRGEYFLSQDPQFRQWLLGVLFGAKDHVV